MTRIKRVLTAAALLMAMAVAGSAACAAAADDSGVVVIGGQQVLRIRASFAGVSPAQRVEALQQRLLDIYQKIGLSDRALTPDEVTIDFTPGAPSIRVRGMLLMTVTPEDAKANGYKTPEDLARVWHVRLRDAIVQAAPIPDDAQYGHPHGEASPSPQ